MMENALEYSLTYIDSRNDTVVTAFPSTRLAVTLKFNLIHPSTKTSNMAGLLHLHRCSHTEQWDKSDDNRLSHSICNVNSFK